MPRFSHGFIEDYDGLVGFGLDRETDEATVRAYMQMISDDECSRALAERMTDQELEEVFNFLSGLLRRHFEEDEYHSLFLKEEHHHG